MSIKISDNTYTDKPDYIKNPTSKSEAAEKCTTDTSRIDRELKELKEKHRQIEQQLRQASDNRQEAEELKAKLAEIDNELRRKDTSAYRRQNSTVDIYL